MPNRCYFSTMALDLIFGAKCLFTQILEYQVFTKIFRCASSAPLGPPQPSSVLLSQLDLSNLSSFEFFDKFDQLLTICRQISTNISSMQLSLNSTKESICRCRTICRQITGLSSTLYDLLSNILLTNQKVDLFLKHYLFDCLMWLAQSHHHIQNERFLLSWPSLHFVSLCQLCFQKYFFAVSWSSQWSCQD